MKTQQQPVCPLCEQPRCDQTALADIPAVFHRDEPRPHTSNPTRTRVRTRPRPEPEVRG